VYGDEAKVFLSNARRAGKSRSIKSLFAAAVHSSSWGRISNLEISFIRSAHARTGKDEAKTLFD
jgi:hypothetical protein